MKALLIGNLRNPHAYSMNGYLERLADELEGLGVAATRLYPEMSEATQKAKKPVAKKWLGYWDVYGRFPRGMLEAADRHDVVHVTDQGLGPLLHWLDADKTIATCHDLLAIRAMLGELNYWKVGRTGRAYQRWILKGLAKAQMMPCVSQATSQDVQRLIGLPPARCPVVANAFYTPVQGERGAAETPFFHSLAHDQPYKNRMGAFRIGEALLSRSEFSGHRLKMMGGEASSALSQAIEQSPVGARVDVEAHPSKEMLAGRILASDLLLFPSLDEGFGLPILEAQSAGCLVATTRHAPMGDVAGEGAILIDPRDPKGAADEIARAWPLREKFIAAGFANLRRFSPRRTAEETLACYHSQLGLGRAA